MRVRGCGLPRHRAILASGPGELDVPERGRRRLTQGIEGRRPTSRAEEPERPGQYEAPAGVHEVGVVEVDVEPARERPEHGTRGHPERVRRRQHEQTRAGREHEPRRLVEREPRRVRRQVPRPEGRPRAVRVPEFPHRLADARVPVPSAAGEERRREPLRCEPTPLLAGRGPPGRRRSGGRARSRPVRVQPERAVGGRLARPFEPRLPTLALALLRGPEQRGDRRAGGARRRKSEYASQTRSSSGRSTWQETVSTPPP